MAFAICLISPSLASAQAISGIRGVCQNLVVSGHNLTKYCDSIVTRLDPGNGRFVYIFKTTEGHSLAFSGNANTLQSLDGKTDDNYYTRMDVDTVYFGKEGNPLEKSIEGRCSLLGNTSYGLTISCRSNDTSRTFSALFFSAGNVTFTKIDEASQ